jgi:hypothetical protein
MKRRVPGQNPLRAAPQEFRIPAPEARLGPHRRAIREAGPNECPTPRSVNAPHAGVWQPVPRRSVECAFRQQRRARASGEPPGVRNATPSGLSGYVFFLGPRSRIGSCRKAQRMRLSFPIAHGLQSREQGFRTFAVVRPRLSPYHDGGPQLVQSQGRTSLKHLLEVGLDRRVDRDHPLAATPFWRA